MSSKVVFPSLSEDGWITDSISVADKVMSHVFCSDYSQTYLYGGNVVSLAWMIRECQEDLPRLISMIEDTWKRYFGSYFNDVVVEVTQTKESLLLSNVGLDIYLTFVDVEGRTHNFARMVEIQDMTIGKIVDILNGVVLQ